MRTCYFDLPCGAAGDMLLAALLDMGFPLALLTEQLSSLQIEPIAISLDTVQRGGVTGKRMVPHLPHSHHHRHLGDILAILKSGKVKDSVYNRCEKVLDRLATAEAKVHGIPKEQVHFHEIGALDTIVDILGVVLALDYLNIDKVTFSTLTDGYGTITVAHGLMPVPVPATAVLIEGYTVKTVQIPTELLTPTGAALLTALGEQVPDCYSGRVLAIGYGCGTKEFAERPNFLRALLLEDTVGTEDEERADAVVVLESDMDHIAGEIMGDVADVLRLKGALDVSWIPLYMKKGRPGYRLSVLAREQDRDPLIDAIILHTRSLGVRFQSMQRAVAKREFGTAMVAGVACSEKRCTYKGYNFSKLEYAALASLARENGCSVLDMMERYVRER